MVYTLYNDVNFLKDHIVAVEKSILIVDDVSEMRELLKQTLRKLDIHKISEAGDAKSALASYKQSPTDAVFLDINMPGGNGLDALRELKEMNEDVKVIMITAESSVDNVVSALGSGADGFIVKPYSIDKIKDAIQKI